MRIEESDLDGFASDITDKCIATRRDRVPAYEGLKHYYLWGAQEGEQAPYGKIYPHIDLLTAYLYSEATVEYEVAVDNQPPVVTAQAELIGRRLNTLFHKRGVAQKFGEALPWALVFNSDFLKFNWGSRGLEPYIVEPHNFGVLREDVTNLDRQEAFVHCYNISKSELARRISSLPNSADILRRVQAAPIVQEDILPESINRMIIAGTSNMTTGTTRGIVNIPELLGRMQYKPRGMEDVIEMYELWVWDDDKEDYRTITLASPGVVIYGRRDIGNLLGIKGEHPFLHICPNRLYDYFFGWSEIAGLIKLQDWATERLREIRDILSKQASPPKALSGWGGITDEKVAALDLAGTWISDPNPGAKVEMLAPDLPGDLWQEIIMIQNMFNDVSGLSDVLQGKGESGVRAKAHADTLAKLGSARIRKRGQNVEGTLNEAGMKFVKIMKAKDKHIYRLEGGEKFTAAQFTDDFQVKVDAHSASPVFAQDEKDLAFALRKFGALDNQSLIELTKPRMQDIIIERLKKAEQAKKEEMAQMLKAGVMPTKGGGLKSISGAGG